MSGPSTPTARRTASDTGTSLLSRLSLSPSKRATQQMSVPDAGPITSSSARSEYIASEPYRSDTSPRKGSPSTPILQGNNPSVVFRTTVNDSPHGPTNSRSRQSESSQSPSVLSYQSVRSPATPIRNGESRNEKPSQDHLSPTRIHTPSSPPRVRQPIYPALASPPHNQPDRALSAAPALWPTNLSEQMYASAARYTSISPEQSAAGPSSPSRVNPSHTPRASPPPAQSNRQTTMQIIASSSGHPDRAVANDKAQYRHDKQGRPLMSARRSATSSSRTVTRLNSTSISTTNPSQSSPPVSPERLHGNSSPLKPERGLTEASAYAKAVSSHLVHSDLQGGQIRVKTDETPSPTAFKPHGGRPLPRPPNATSDPATLPRQNTSGPQPPPSTTDSKQNPPAQYRKIVQSSAAQYRGDSSESTAVTFDFPRSPTVPALNDPRQSNHREAAPDTGRNEQVKANVLERNVPDVARPPMAGREGRTRGVNGMELRRPSGRLTLQHLLGHPTIQSALLSTISINAFLSLTGSTEFVRHQFTGESVGRWVLREWGVQVPSSFGARWPNLTVWEGFLESLLHDPATYSTYPARWHNLLRHLSLSHSLVVLFLRNLPQSCFPNHSLLPFEDEGPSITSLPFSPSSTSLASMGQPRSRVGSVAGSETGSLAPSSRPPRRERVIEIVMPEPLAGQPQEELIAPEVVPKPIRRRGSISSLASAASFSFGRRRSHSNAADARPSSRANGFTALAEPTASMAPGKSGPPPVSYPSAKRYGFKGPNDGLPRSRSSSIAPRPGSIFSMQTSPSVSSYAPRMSQALGARLHTTDIFQPPLPAPPPLTVRPRSSFGSADSNRRSDRDQNSPIPSRRAVFPGLSPPRCEPAFDRPMPFIPGRVPVLRVFVPLSETVRRWPSAEGAVAAIEELEKCGAMKRMQLGDLIVNTAIRAPRTTEHVLVYVPFVKHLLVPLQYVHASTGHLPSYIDAFALPPSYFYPFLPAPQIIYLNLGPYKEQGLRSMRLASDRRDMTIASGAKISAKRYLYVAGVEITANDKAAPEWQGMVSLEAEGTAEGKFDLEARFGSGQNRKGILAPWEIVKEKSMGGTVWLRLVKEKPG